MRAVGTGLGALYAGLRRGLWSLANGFLAVPVGLLLETFRYGWHRFNQSVDRRHYVDEIWRERSNYELCLYFLGQLLFVSSPLFVLLATGSETAARYCWYFCPTGFALLTIVTLLFPIGARRRYKRLITRHRTGYERLFLGLMPPNLLFTARGDGLRACLSELIGYLLLIVLGAAATQLALYGIDPAQFHVDPDIAPPLFSPGLLLDFLFISISAMLTSEYAGLSPIGLLAQTVVATELVLGSIYLVAIIPTVVTLMARRRPSRPALESPRGELVGACIAGGVDWLVRQQRHSSHWQGQLPADLVATCLARPFLAANVADPRSAAALAKLDGGLTALRGGRLDWLERLVLAIADDSVPPADLIPSFAKLGARSPPGEHQSMLAALFALCLGRLPLHAVRRYLPDDPVAWGQAYGPHWDCYALLGRLLVAQLPHGEALDRGELKEDAGEHYLELIRRRADNGSWYEDVSLTALIGLAFTRLGLFQVRVHDAAIWMMREADRHGAGLPLFGGLTVWDTAWATRALQDEMEDSETVRAAIDWLVSVGVRRGFEGEWSWSTGIALTCFDSSSLACEVLLRTPLKDVRPVSAMEAGLERLEAVRDGFRYPTFAPEGRGIQYCPIISARVVRLLQEREGHARPEVEAILDRVVNDGWISEWFADPAVSRGLVLAYLAAFCPPRLRSARLLTERIAAQAPHSAEGAAAMLLGLAAAERNLQLSQANREACARQVRRLIDDLIARRSNHHWKGERIGTFGFGRRYADPVFATALAVRALAAQSPARP